MDILQIRPAIAGDAGALEDIFAGCDERLSVLPLPRGREGVEAFLRESGAEFPVFVAQKGQIIGSGCLQPFTGFPSLRTACCIGICVREDKRGQGIGRALLDYALFECRRLGYHTAIAPLHAEDRIAIELFRRSGFSHDFHLPQIIAEEDRYASLFLLWKTID